MNSGKSSIALVPPLSLTTTFTSVSCGAISSLVIVHVLLSPGCNVIVPSALQSPPQTDAAYPV